MTNRIKSLTITLKANTREDDCQILVDAIKLFPHVKEVEKEVFDLSKEIERENLYDTVKYEVYRKIGDYINSMTITG